MFWIYSGNDLVVMIYITADWSSSNFKFFFAEKPSNKMYKNCAKTLVTTWFFCEFLGSVCSCRSFCKLQSNCPGYNNYVSPWPRPFLLWWQLINLCNFQVSKWRYYPTFSFISRNKFAKLIMMPNLFLSFFFPQMSLILTLL